MNKGRATCEYLKEIRRRVAAENGIELEIPHCDFEGECEGTCPQCEGEVRYLESELAKQGKVGKIIAVAGLAASLSVMTACQTQPLRGKMPAGDPTVKPTDPELEIRGKTQATYTDQEAMPDTAVVRGLVPKVIDKAEEGSSTPQK